MATLETLYAAINPVRQATELSMSEFIRKVATHDHGQLLWRICWLFWQDDGDGHGWDLADTLRGKTACQDGGIVPCEWADQGYDNIRIQLSNVTVLDPSQALASDLLSWEVEGFEASKSENWKPHTSPPYAVADCTVYVNQAKVEGRWYRCAQYVAVGKVRVNIYA